MLSHTPTVKISHGRVPEKLSVLAAPSLLHACSSGKSLISASHSPFLPEKSLSSLEIKGKTGGGNKRMLRSRKQSIK